MFQLRCAFPSVGAFVCCGVLSLASLYLPSAGAEAPRVLPAGELPKDSRLGDFKNLEGYFPFTPPATPEEWHARAERVRRQVEVATGVWPRPTPTPLNAVVHGRVERDDFTVDRVYFESYPGHYVTGSLFKPKKSTGKMPAVLCPHGHWANGRFYDAGEQAVKEQIASGAEKFEVGGRYPLQARCIHLARMGCVVFHYDMLGYADSQQISFDVGHRFNKQRPEMDRESNYGFFSPMAELRLQSIMGLQTYNSVRALDFVCSLPEVDTSRLGVTGASGGGTQTFLLTAVDPRPAVAFPAVMVSTAMQGGCTCENCTYLRVNTGNIELAGLFAPKPLGMSAADDWTKELETKGLPELKQLYSMLGAPDNVTAALLTQYPHNYNHPSRAAMYGWFHKHLQLAGDHAPEEQDFAPLSQAELTVWDAEHPRPVSGPAHERALLAAISHDSDMLLHKLAMRGPEDKEFRRVVGGAYDVLIGRGLSPKEAFEQEVKEEADSGSYLRIHTLLKYKPAGEEIPVIYLLPKEWNKEAVIWLHAQGKAGAFNEDGSANAQVTQLLEKGYAVALPDLLYQGDYLADGQPMSASRLVAPPRDYAGFVLGYNTSLFAQRVQDVLSLVSYIQTDDHGTKAIHLVGLGDAAPWAIAARAQAGNVVSKLVVEETGFRFRQVHRMDDPAFFPGSVKYGDIAALLLLSAPHPTWVARTTSNDDGLWQNMPKLYSQGLTVVTATPNDVAQQAVDWLTQ